MGALKVGRTLQVHLQVSQRSPRGALCHPPACGGCTHPGSCRCARDQPRSSEGLGFCTLLTLVWVLRLESSVRNGPGPTTSPARDIGESVTLAVPVFPCRTRPLSPTETCLLGSRSAICHRGRGLDSERGPWTASRDELLHHQHPRRDSH